MLPLVLVVVALAATAVPRGREFSDAELDAFAATARAQGFVRLPGVLDPSLLREIRAAFAPVLAARMAAAPPDRGPMR